MPIIDVSLVLAPHLDVPADAAKRIADRLGAALKLAPGHLWVRLHRLPASSYAENDTKIDATELPVFVRVLHARPPTGSTLSEEAARVGCVVAAVIERDPARVHVEYAPPGAGRIAFGGKLVPPASGMESHFILYVADQQRSRHFYARVFATPPRLDVSGMTEFALPSGGILGLMPESGIKSLLGDGLPDPARASGVPRAELYLVVAQPEAYHARACDAGAIEISPLRPRAWGHAVAYSLDPDGHVLAFAAPLE